MFEGNECDHAADNCTMVAGQAAVTDEVGCKLPGLDAVDDKFQNASNKPAKKGVNA